MVGGAAAVLSGSARGGERCRLAVRLGLVNLGDKPVDELPDRCEECGARLTPAEIQAAMESGGPALCSIHAAEDEPGLEADEAGFLGEE